MNKRQAKKQSKQVSTRISKQQVREIKRTAREKEKAERLQAVRERQEQRDRQLKSQPDYKKYTKNEKAKQLLQWKKDQLNQLGYDVSKLRVKDLRSLKKSDIENKSIPDAYRVKIFDYNRVYHFEPNRNMYFAFRDFADHKTLEDIIKEFSNLSNSELLKRLDEIVNMPMTYTKTVKNSESSGRAGDVRFQSGSKNILKKFDDNTKFENAESKQHLKNRTSTKYRVHTKNFKGFQVLVDENENQSFSKASARGLMIIANAIMWNITETSRDSFYQEFYYAVVKNIPELEGIFPTP